MTLMNISITIIASLACTAATGAVLYYTSQYLIQDHHNTCKKNDFKRGIRTLKLTLKSLAAEHSTYAKQIRGCVKASRETLPPLDLIKSPSRASSCDHDSGDDTSSVTSTSTLAMGTKKILELEECLTRLLEKCDAVSPKALLSELEPIVKHLSAAEKETLVLMAEQVAVTKKGLILAIQKTCAELEGVAAHSAREAGHPI
ncbi:hypothetical protein HDV03_004832 [Kappamyces sp. JEL0829]|nr:hypothetical protein HDV03_004832 [Kappamyces sp. JEL0829]